MNKIDVEDNILMLNEKCRLLLGDNEAEWKFACPCCDTITDYETMVNFMKEEAVTLETAEIMMKYYYLQMINLI